MSAPMRKLSKQLMANKKQFYMLLAVVAVALLLWGRLLLKNPPRSAMAKPRAAAAATGAGDAQADNTDSFVFTRWKTVHVDLPEGEPRDLFLFDPAGYPRVVVQPKKVDDPGPVSGKSDPQPDDKLHKMEELTKRAAALKLQTTLDGAQPQALINGRLMLEGQQIDGFTVQKILARQVVIEIEGVEFRLKM